MKTFMKSIFIAIALALALLLSILALTNNTQKTEGQSYLIPPDGKIQKQSGKFIEVEFQQYKVDGLILFKGVCQWNVTVDPNRSFAIVPVKLFRKVEEEQKLVPVAVYYTAEDGKFYLITEDDGSGYVLGPVTSQAVNMPAKVNSFSMNSINKKKISKGEVIE